MIQQRNQFQFTANDKFDTMLEIPTFLEPNLPPKDLVKLTDFSNTKTLNQHREFSLKNHLMDITALDTLQDNYY